MGAGPCRASERRNHTLCAQNRLCCASFSHSNDIHADGPIHSINRHYPLWGAVGYGIPTSRFLAAFCVRGGASSSSPPGFSLAHFFGSVDRIGHMFEPLVRSIIRSTDRPQRDCHSNSRHESNVSSRNRDNDRTCGRNAGCVHLPRVGSVYASGHGRAIEAISASRR